VSGLRTLALVLAGGKGHRFWPRSTDAKPKQFLGLGGGQSLLQATTARLSLLLPSEGIHVVTTAAHETLVREQLPDLPPGNIIVEPASRDTAAAIGYAFTLLGEEEADAVAAVVPSDHFITGVPAWVRAVSDACLVAESGRPVLIGIRPCRPDSAYGYVLLGEALPTGDLVPAGSTRPATPGGTQFHRVSRFVEKPDRALAERLLQEGRCLWNSGMFVWKVSTALDLIRLHLPATHAVLGEISRLARERGAPPQGSPAWRARVASLYARLEPVSVDYGVLEKTSEVAVGLGEFGWDDLGGWESLTRLLPRDGKGNVVRGEAILHNAEGCIVDWVGGPVVVIGLRDAVIAGGTGPLLACARDRLGELKSVLASEEFRAASARVKTGKDRAQ